MEYRCGLRLTSGDQAALGGGGSPSVVVSGDTYLVLFVDTTKAMGISEYKVKYDFYQMIFVRDHMIVESIPRTNKHGPVLRVRSLSLRAKKSYATCQRPRVFKPDTYPR